MNEKENQNNNVIDFQTGRRLLPREIGSSIIGQYSESRHNDDTPEMFLTKLERRITADLAYKAAQTVREFATGLMNDDRPEQ